MKVIRTARQLGPGKVCLAIGVFDGVHLGHQQVIRQTMGDATQRGARAVVVTFDRHPNSVVAPARLPAMLQTVPQRLRVIAQLGVHATLLLPFTPELSRIPGGDFIRGLARDFGRLLSVCVGGNFSFGYQRTGNVNLLRALGQELDFQVHGLAAVALDGIAVSSTRIRQALQAGHLDQVGQMLGRPYSLCGQVVAGDQLGRQLGFPTANLEVKGLALPSPGVYGVLASSPSPAPGRPPLVGNHLAVLNIGIRPTLGKADPQVRVETHLLDFHGELYGQELELTLVAKLREEKKFDSLDALKAQITQDVAQARVL